MCSGYNVAMYREHGICNWHESKLQLRLMCTISADYCKLMSLTSRSPVLTHAHHTTDLSFVQHLYHMTHALFRVIFIQTHAIRLHSYRKQLTTAMQRKL